MFNKMYKYLLIFIIVLGVIVTGCSKEEENPHEIFENYISHWMEMDFEEMYKILSPDSKSYISQEDFTSRYENIYSGISGEDILITTIIEDEEFDKDENTVEIPYSFEMNTIAGKIDFDHKVNFVKDEVEEGDKWYVKWDESMIFPDMEQGDIVKVVTNTAERGRIIDINGISIADNGEIRSIGIVPEDLGEQADKTKETLADAFQMSIEDINRRLEANWVQPHLFVPIGSLSLEEEDKAIELTNLSGVLAQRMPARVYPLGELTAHLVGYIGNISAEELEKLQADGYTDNSIIGKTGLEQIYEDRIRARDGKAIHIHDDNNLFKKTLVEKGAENGEDIQLTIDTHLQRSIYEQMGDEKGTAVAMNPKTGEVLALVNTPSYNPNNFVLGLSNQQWDDLNEDPDRPLLNRFSQRYSPGSVFKPIVAAIGLENGSINPEDELDITGLQWQNDPSWGNYYITRVSDSASTVNLKDALVYSDNIYFARLSLNLGEDAFINGAEKFGIGNEMEFDYPIRSSQITTDGSFSGEIQLADSGYGQGEVELSPLHLTTMYTTFFNGGNMLRPILLKEKGKNSIIWEEGVMSKSNAEIIKEDLVQVIEHPQGTGSLAKIQGRLLGGKTGTAEFKHSQEEEGQNKGWFIAFDNDNENIIITMMLEDVDGSSVVIPKVRDVIEAY